MKMKHNNKGFSLVELIVVIAIMAILAGVGTAGYTKYIEQTNKKADMALVGNIERAIDTGAYSLMQEVDDVLQLSQTGAQFPIGCIVLSKEGGTIVESLGEENATIESQACKLDTKIFDILTSYEYGSRWNKKTAYVISENIEKTYCSTHSTVNTSTYKIGIESGDENPSNKQLYVLSDCKLVLNHTDGEYRKSYSGSFAQKGMENTKMGKILSAAYGDDYGNLIKLKYDGWTDYKVPTLFSSATSIWASVKDISSAIDSSLMQEGIKLPIIGTTLISGQSLQSLLFDESFDDSSDMIVSVSNDIVTRDNGKELFINGWKAVDESGEDSKLGDIYVYEASDFGGLTGRANYSAARKLYNASFASYVSSDKRTEHEPIEDLPANTSFNNSKVKHIDYINDFGAVPGADTAVGEFIEYLGDYKIPQVICNSAFTTASPLADDVKNCKTCRELYDEYVNSGESLKNAEAVYSVLESINDTGSDVRASEGNDGFYNYYNNYMKEFEGLFDAAEAAAVDESNIIISVYAKDGLLKYDVSPAEADPRPKKN